MGEIQKDLDTTIIRPIPENTERNLNILPEEQESSQRSYNATKHRLEELDQTTRKLLAEEKNTETNKKPKGIRS